MSLLWAVVITAGFILIVRAALRPKSWREAGVFAGRVKRHPIRFVAAVLVLLAFLSIMSSQPDQSSTHSESTAPAAKASAPVTRPEPAAPRLPDYPVDRGDVEATVASYLREKYKNDDVYSLRSCKSTPDKGKEVVAVALSRKIVGLTNGLMKRGAVLEVMEIVQELSLSPSMEAVHLLQIGVSLPGSDKYGRPVDAMGVAFSIETEDARKINWEAMTSDMFVELADDVGAAFIHPSLR